MSQEVRKKEKSDVSRAFSEDGPLKTHVGGQALIEGVMMRGKINWAAAVRESDGSMYVEEHDINSGNKSRNWLHKPLIRGCTALVESLLIGYKALEVSVEHAYPDDEDEQDNKVLPDQDDSKDERVLPQDDMQGDFQRDSLEAHRGIGSQTNETRGDIAKDCSAQAGEAINDVNNESENSKEANNDGLVKNEDKSEELVKKEDKSEDKDEGALPKGVMTGSMIIGVVLGIAVFIVVPAFIANLIVGEYAERTLLWNIVDGVLRIAIFIGYIWLIGRMKDMRRMFMYHGAEHKTIHCYEHGLPLTPENARRFPRLHVRCGTAFLIMVMIIAIIVYTIIPLNLLITALGVPEGAPAFVLVLIVRIIFLPLIAGISYEITVKWAGSHPENPVVKVILWPGLQLQYLTTHEPDDSMLECAIAAMQCVIDRESLSTAENDVILD